MGIFQGMWQSAMRTYAGETTNTVMAMLPLEEQRSSKIKQNCFLLLFPVGTINVAVGPGKPAYLNIAGIMKIQVLVLRFILVTIIELDCCTHFVEIERCH